MCLTSQLAWLLKPSSFSLLFPLFLFIHWVLDRSRGLGAFKLGKSRREEDCNERAITQSTEGVMDEKEWRRKGKELKDERIGDALHFSSSGVSNRLPVTDYPKNLRTTNSRL